jgi:hypothetical protein
MRNFNGPLPQIEIPIGRKFKERLSGRGLLREGRQHIPDLLKLKIGNQLLVEISHGALK